MFKKNILMTTTATLFCFYSFSSFASEWSEAEELSRLVKHLESAEEIITKAEFERNTYKRVQFDYPALRLSIKQIKQGIKSHLNKPLEPRSYKAIKNSFSTYEKQGGK